MNSEIERANSLYKRSQQPFGVSQTSRKSLLLTALAIYHSQCKNVSPANVVSLRRNIGVCNLRLAKVLDPKFDLKMIFYHLSEAVNNLTNVWSSRQVASADDSEWASKVEELIVDCFQLSFRSIDGDVETYQIPNFHLLDNIEKAMGTSTCFDFPIRMRFHLAKGQYFYCCGVKSLEAGNFKITLQLLEYCRGEAENAIRVSKQKHEAIDEIERFKEDIGFLRCCCESVRLRTNGDELFTIYMNDDKESNFEIMWDILDMYKAAALQCREKDLEIEAVAISRQARLFDRVFKLRNKAKEYYKQAMNLAQTLFPQDLINATWFHETKRMLAKYQQMDLAEEEKKKESERAPYLKKMKTELDELERIHRKSDAYKLLQYVYLTHPPKIGNATYDEKEVNSTNIKKTMMKAITQYHPDKQSEFGMDWKVLSEEITKRLTAQYESMKGI